MMHLQPRLPQTVGFEESLQWLQIPGSQHNQLILDNAIDIGLGQQYHGYKIFEDGSLAPQGNLHLRIVRSLKNRHGIVLKYWEGSDKWRKTTCDNIADDVEFYIKTKSATSNLRITINSIRQVTIYHDGFSARYQIQPDLRNFKSQGVESAIFGEVRVCLDRINAVKVVKHGCLVRPVTSGDFISPLGLKRGMNEHPMREIEITRHIAASLNHLTGRNGHENIISFDKLFADTRNIFIVMPFMTQKDLFTLIYRSVNESEDCESIASECCKQLSSALQFLHSIGISHCDISSENILVTRTAMGSLHFLLTDFGQAVLHDYVPGTDTFAPLPPEPLGFARGKPIYYCPDTYFPMLEGSPTLAIAVPAAASATATAAATISTQLPAANALFTAATATNARLCSPYFGFQTDMWQLGVLLIFAATGCLAFHYVPLHQHPKCRQCNNSIVTWFETIAGGGLSDLERDPSSSLQPFFAPARYAGPDPPPAISSSSASLQSLQSAADGVGAGSSGQSSIESGGGGGGGGGGGFPSATPARVCLRNLISPALLDLLTGLLQCDPAKRLSIQDVVRHPWLGAVDAGSSSAPNNSAVVIDGASADNTNGGASSAPSSSSAAAAAVPAISSAPTSDLSLTATGVTVSSAFPGLVESVSSTI